DEREDSESQIITSGGKKGDEIILRFLEEVGNYLSENGKVLLLVSSLTPFEEIEKVLLREGFSKKVVSREKVFMEELIVWEIRKS
ncbi:MAG: methyltransferase, partial [Nanoarchaeota archaeon]|nr:methyltransferase [Nanoarchaeota archaeon]